MSPLTPSSPSQIPTQKSARGWLWGGLAIGGALCVFAAFAWGKIGELRALPRNRVAEYVGRDRCSQCHPQEASAFQGSHHDLAMDLATPQSVLASFDGQEYEHLGVRARMFQKDGKYFVRTEGRNGTEEDFPVTHVFGVEPLQQYLVSMDPSSSEDGLGRLQVLRWSWNSRKKEWFHLDPPDVHDRLLPDDPLHWTGVAQCWNTSCADCHSTNLQKHHDPISNQFATTFSEMDVSCEACHGPGSIHVELARRWVGKTDPYHGIGLPDLTQDQSQQLDSCAPCHSRRGLLQEGYHPGNSYHDFFTESLLEPSLYFADGQIRDEVYEHGSFLQSKMYHRGIRCSDCHDPHTARLKQSGNAVCTSCHQHPAAKYDTPAHHFHPIGKEGSQCVDCHMPETTYMDLDARRDHSLRIPRPDLSLRWKTPNACSKCHIDRVHPREEIQPRLKQYLDWLVLAEQGDTELQLLLEEVDRWCNEACDRWYGGSRRKDPHFVESLGLLRNPNATPSRPESWLARRGSEAPAIARASLIDQLSRNGASPNARLLDPVRQDSEPLVRRALAAWLSNPLQGEGPKEWVRQLLSDDLLSVRVAAARGAIHANPGLWESLSASERDRAVESLRTALRANSDRAGALLESGILDERLGLLESAQRHYQQALQVEPQAVGPRTNLASLFQRIIDQNPNSRETSKLEGRIASLRNEELPLLERDARLLPNSSDLRYRLGLAYYLAGKEEEALSELEQAIFLAPNSLDFQLARALLLQKLNRRDEALNSMQILRSLAPEDPRIRAMNDDPYWRSQPEDRP